jgi:outer membrane biosynthesis protein TonB
MALLETTHQKKSAAITLVLLILMILAMFRFGMDYVDPPEEYGLAINFGDSSVGTGAPVERVKSQPQKKAAPEEIEEKQEVATIPEETIQEEVIIQDVKETPVVEIPKEEVVEEPIKKIIEKTIEKIVEKEKPKEIPKPTPSKETQDALANLLNENAANEKPKGEGDDRAPGVKGNKNGDPTSSAYYGNQGSGTDRNYNLAGRKAMSKPIEKPACNEEGIVVVRIEVDKTGKVINATPGVKGSTNTAPCLLKPAKAAALKTKWNPDGKAPSKQKGTIIYRFSLSE